MNRMRDFQNRALSASGGDADERRKEMQNVLNFKVSRIHRLPNGGSMKAFADVNINDSIVIRGLRVVEGKNGLFVSMPQEQGKDKKWYDTIRCLTNEVRHQISSDVLQAYEEEGKRV